MKYPAFYGEVAPIVLHDPLAKFLGATEDGNLEVNYVDAVRLAGHSCPTIAGAWLMAARAVQELFPGEKVQRGNVDVQMRDSQDEGVTGVVASVFTLVFGAAGPGGFHGLAGKNDRRNLLTFGNEVSGEVRFTRKDTGQSVTLNYDHSSVPGNPEMMPLMQKGMTGQADAAEMARFQSLWTTRVKSILLDHGQDLVTVVGR